MEKLEKVSGQSMDIVADNITKLKALFPELLTENKIDFDKLRQMLGDEIEVNDERFGFYWNGKANSRRGALKPSTGTLRPAKDASLEWDETKNLIIEGDNLEVLKLLQKSFHKKIKAIYIDPPYNTGRDLIYPNDFKDGIKNYLEITGQIEGGSRLNTNTESSGRFHSNWLNLMYPRLLLAKSLLKEDGVLVCTIDENEQVNLGGMLKEVYDEGTYEHVCVTIVHNPRGIQGTNFSYTHEYAFFIFRRGIKAIGDRKIEDEDISWSQFRNWGTESERSDAKNCFYPVTVKNGEIIGFGDVCSDDFHPNQTELIDDTYYVYPIDRDGVERKWRYARQSVDSIHNFLKAKRTAGGYEVEIGKNFGLYKTVWTDKKYDANEYGTKIVNSLVEGSPFSFPKSLWNVYDSLYAIVGDDKDALVLDFFAGSGTTGHAILEMNKNDSGKRRYILVQLPEPIEEHSKYKTIADVTKERLKQASKKIKSENPTLNLDCGFKVFKLDSSNLKPWDADFDTLATDLAEAADIIKADRSSEDVLFEILLKYGLDLTLPIEAHQLAGKTVYEVGAGALIVCLDNAVTEAVAEAIGKLKESLAPEVMRVVFKDSSFANDAAKVNAVQVLKQYGIEDVKAI